MTSKSLSLNDRFRNYRKYITRTLWTSLLGFFLMAVYYILGVVIMISRTASYAKLYNQSEEVFRHARYNAVGRVMGLEQLGFLIIIVMAIAFAFQGFSYLFDQKKIDFYISQPTTRAQRFWRNYFGAFGTFLAIYLVTEILALIVAAAMGGIGEVVLMSILCETVRSIILFFAVYNITLFAILLCGTLPVAALLLLFLLAITYVIGFELDIYSGLFFATSDYHSATTIIGSPIYDRFNVLYNLKRLADLSTYYDDFKLFNRSLKNILPGTIDTLVTGIIFLVLSVVFSTLRRAEHAGQTICYRPFRWIIKVIGCVVVGIASGYMVYVVYNYSWNTRFLVIMVTVMALTTIVSGCIIEAILENNIRKSFSGKAQTVMALAIVGLIFVIFNGDLLGFDSYVPKASSVESCAILDNEYNYNFKSMYYDTTEEFMEITDIETFEKIARLGMETQKKVRDNERNHTYRNYGWTTEILYRLKSGRKVYRTICIPFDIDEALLKSIIDSEEYKTGHYIVFHDEDIREYEKNARYVEIAFNTSTYNVSTKAMPYSELSDAYRKDILENCSFDLLRSSRPIGEVNYDITCYDLLDYSYSYANGSLDVYDNYTNTISVLEKYGIYSDTNLDVKCILSVDVTNYYPGYDLSQEDIYELDNMVIETKTVTYTDAESIKDIIDSSVNTDYYNAWYDHSLVDNQYGIVVTLDTPRDAYGVYTTYYNFKLGKVPDFVVKDTN